MISMEKYLSKEDNETAAYRAFLREIEERENDYENFKTSLNENEQNLAKVIEEKLTSISNAKIEFLTLKHQDELKLKIASLKLVMSSISSASAKCLNDETCEKITRIQTELSDLKSDLGSKCNEVLSYRNEIQILEKATNELRRQLAERESHIESLKVKESSYLSELNELKDRLHDQNDDEVAINIEREDANSMSQEDHYVSTTTTVHQQHQTSDLISFESATTTIIIAPPDESSDGESAAMESCCSSMTPRTNHEPNNPAIGATILIQRAPNQADVESSFKTRYFELRDSIEKLSHPVFIQFENEIEAKHRKEYEKLKLSYEKKLNDEIDFYKKHIIELEEKQKKEIENLEKEYNQVLSSDLDELKKELKKSSQNQGIGINFRFVSERRQREITDSNDFNMYFDETINLNNNNNNGEERRNSENYSICRNISVTSTTLNDEDNKTPRQQQQQREKENRSDENKEEQKERRTTREDDEVLLIEHEMPIVNSSSSNENSLLSSSHNGSSSGSSSDHDGENGNKADAVLFEKIIEIEPAETTNTTTTSNGAATYEKKLKREILTSENYVKIKEDLLIDELEKKEKQIQELDERLKQVLMKNETLQNTLKSLYEKDDVFMASIRRENEERDNSLRLLQSELDKSTIQSNTLQMKNQNLSNLLSKISLITSTIEDHVNRRFNRILVNNSTVFAGCLAITSPKNVGGGTSSTSGESGLTGSSDMVANTAHINDADSNDDDGLSDDGDLDYSQKFSGGEFTHHNHHHNAHSPNDHGSSEHLNDDMFIEASVKLQTSIDKVMNKFEELSSQFPDAQVQLIMKLEETEKAYGELRAKLDAAEAESRERVEELQAKIDNLEGLVNAHEMDKDGQMRRLAALEDDLADANKQLENARNQIECDKYELSSLENLRKDWEAQRSCLTRDLQDSDLKAVVVENRSPALIENNSQLLDETHELKYMMKKTNEKQEQQIRELESSIEQSNYENKLLKEQYEEKIHELRKQMESMEAQIRSERGFIESQMSEREQEREDYEKKINELKQLLTKKSTDMFEAEDAVSNRIKELSIQLQEKSDRVNQLLLENEQLERNVNEKENGLQSQAHTLKEAEKRLQTLSTEKEELEKKVEQLNEDMNALLKANKAHADVINNLKESLNESVAKSKEYIDARDNWIKEKEDLVQEKANIQNQMYRYMNELSEMKLFKENIDMEHKNQIKSLEDKINSLSAAIDDKEHQNEKLQETVNELHADFQTKLDLELKSELDQLKNLQEQNDSQISQSYESQIDRLKTEIAALKDEITSKEKAIESEKKAFDNMIQNLVDNKNETIEELNEEMDKLKKKSIDEAEKTRDELRARDDKIERLEGELARVTAEMASCKDGYEIQIGNLNENFKNQLETFNDLIEKLKVEKEAFYAETETLKAETDSLKETNRELTERDQKMAENEAKLNAKISELSDEISSIGTELELANQSVLTKEQIIETLNADIEEIRAQLSQTENELREKRESFENLEKDLQSNLNKLESIEMRNKELNDELLKARSMLEKSRSDSDCQTDWTEDEKHLEQIEVLKAQHLSELESLRANLEAKSRVEIERLENTLKAEYEKQMAQLKDQYEREMDESDNSTSADISASNDNFKKLREQIKRSKELDEEILGKMNEKMTDSSSTKKPTEAIPNEIKEILDKLENEGILLLSMSEIMRLKSHIQSQNSSSEPQQPQQQQQEEINSRLKAVAIENEKDQLIMEIYKLRHLLSDIKNLNNLCTSLDESDWRSAILKAISDIFLNQKEHLLAELRSFISNNGFTQQSDYVAHLENKIDDLTKLNAKSMEYLISIDRESFQKEIEALKQKNKKVQEQVAALQESDRELKRALKIMEYEKDTEAIKGNDMKQSLNAERSKCLEMTDKLNQEQKKANSMQEQLSQLNEEVAAFKRSLNEQTTSLDKICKELDAERIKNDQLNTLLEKKSSSRGYEQDENDFSKENQIHRMYLRNSNSGEQQQKSNGGVNGGERQRSSSSMLIDNQIIELEKHANSLHNLLAQEKEKNQKLTKALNDLKNNYIKVASAEIQSNAMNMERIRQSLEYLALKHRDKLDSTSSSSKQQKYVTELKSNLADIISELENLDKTTMPATAAASRSLDGGEEVVSAPSSLEVRLLQQNKEMLKSIKSLSTEKVELKSNLTRLEEEIWNYKNKYKNEINTLTEHDREKFKKLYYKYLRAESFRKSLVYQKRFLLIMLNGYEETEREIIATLENNLALKNQILTNNNSSSQYAHTVVNNHHNNRNGQQQQQQICTTVQQHVDNKNTSTSYYYSSRFMVKKPKSRFRTGVICVIAISRIKFLQRKHSHIISSKN